MSVRATKMPSGNWRCKANYTDVDGKYRNKSFTAETKKEAEYLAAVFLMEMKHKKKPANRTIGELIDLYLDNRSNILSPSTMVLLRQMPGTWAKTQRCTTGEKIPPEQGGYRHGLAAQKAFIYAVFRMQKTGDRVN